MYHYYFIFIPFILIYFLLQTILSYCFCDSSLPLTIALWMQLRQQLYWCWGVFKLCTIDLIRRHLSALRLPALWYELLLCGISVGHRSWVSEETTPPTCVSCLFLNDAYQCQWPEWERWCKRLFLMLINMQVFTVSQGSIQLQLWNQHCMK